MEMKLLRLKQTKCAIKMIAFCVYTTVVEFFQNSLEKAKRKLFFAK